MAFGFEFLGVCLPAQFEASPDLIETFQPELISVRIFKPRISPAPPWRLRRKQEPHTAFTPFFVLGVNIFGHEKNPAIAANQLVFWPVWFWLNQGKIRGTVGRCHFDPADAIRKALFCDEFEAQLVDVEPLTHFPGRGRKRRCPGCTNRAPVRKTRVGSCRGTCMVPSRWHPYCVVDYLDRFRELASRGGCLVGNT